MREREGKKKKNETLPYFLTVKCDKMGYGSLMGRVRNSGRKVSLFKIQVGKVSHPKPKMHKV